MAWDLMTVTTKGTELLASASASDQLTIVGCDADSTVYSTVDSAKAVSTRPVSPLRNTTDVTILFTQNNNLFSRAYFGTGTSATSDVNTLYLYGKLDSSEDLYVVAVASSSITTHLPVSGDPSESFQALFNFMYNVPNTAAVTASSASFATIAELNDLASRVVTTNIQGSTTTGENQNIRGEKAFLSRLYANQGFTSNAISYVYGALNIAYSTQSYMLSIQYVGGSSSTVASQGYSRICTKDSGQNDGTAILRLGTWGSGGTYNYYLNLVKETRWQDFPSGFYWDFTAAAIFREVIFLGGNIIPNPDSSAQGYKDINIGSSGRPIKFIASKKILCDDLSSIGNDILLDGVEFNCKDVEFNGGVHFSPNIGANQNITFNRQGFNIEVTSGGSIDFDDTGIFVNTNPLVNFDIGTLDYPIHSVKSKQIIAEEGIYVSTYGGATGQTIGTSSAPFDSVYANNFHGCLPYPNNTSQAISERFPVGCIIKAVAQAGAFTTTTLGFSCGAQNINSDTYQINVAEFNPNDKIWVSDNNYNLNSVAGAMKWVALSSVRNLGGSTVARTTECEVFITRIA